MKSKKVLRFLLIYFLSGISFFLLTQPFHKILAVFTFTEVRPSAVLYPFLGISFGWPAALGIMTANFISDVLNDYSLPILLEGMILQLIYVMAPTYLWRYIMKKQDHKHRLDCVGRVLKYVLICFVFSVISGVGVGCLMYFNMHLEPVQIALFVLLNNFDMSVVLGCPLMVISNQIISRHAGTDRTLTRNEQIIIITAVMQVLLTFSVAAAVYTDGRTIGNYDVWNTIYLIGTVLTNITMLLSLICMALFGKKNGDGV